jgi:hypothetical protein
VDFCLHLRLLGWGLKLELAGEKGEKGVRRNFTQKFKQEFAETAR